MPRTALPPTPAASGDIVGKDETHLPVVDKAFNLPPPALNHSRNHAPASTPKAIQPATGPNFSLPPPPTRSRTIIQMKPKPSQTAAPAEKRPTSKGSGGSTRKASTQSGAAGKKQPSSTSLAGKKIARKTAHSVIERRRRSKMNEEFGVLKAMIPACTDQEMHKLAILQASIDYLRYLENCIGELKAANKSLSTPLLEPQPPPPRINTSMPHSGSLYHDDDDDEIEDEDNDDEDVTMEDANNSSASLTPALSAQTYTAGTSAYTSPQSIQHSPALDAPRTSHRGSYSSLSTLPSPAFGPQKPYTNNNNDPTNVNVSVKNEYRSSSHHPSSSHASQHQQHNQHIAAYPPLSLSASTSPTIMPSHNDNANNKEQDHEATAALLMLNQDRRSTKGGSGGSGGSGSSHASMNPTTNERAGGRGMSVKDLLSS